MTQQQPVAVEQVDREAADKWKGVWGSFAERLPAEDLAYAFARHRLAATPPEPAATAGDIVAEVVGLARRDIARTQTDFLGRMSQALCEYEGAFDEYPDGDLPDDVREDADCQIAGLAGLALAQLALLRSPSDALALLEPAATAGAARVAALIAKVEAGQFDDLDQAADQWAASVGVQRMMNAIASVFERHAPQDIMDRFREKLAAQMHLAFVEGAAQGVLQLKALPADQPPAAQAPAIPAVTSETPCLCCCRPKSEHEKGQCPETTYFVPNVAAAPKPAAQEDATAHSLKGWKNAPPRPSTAMIQAAEREGYSPDAAMDVWVAMHAACGEVTTYKVVPVPTVLQKHSAALGEASTIEKLRRIRASMILLQQNSEGCALNHYGDDGRLHGMPGWLMGTAVDIERLTDMLAALSTPPRRGDDAGLREALEPFAVIPLDGWNTPDGYPDPRLWRQHLVAARAALATHSAPAADHEAEGGR